MQQQQQEDAPAARDIEAAMAETIVARFSPGADPETEEGRLLRAFARIDKASVRDVVLRMVERIATG